MPLSQPETLPFLPVCGKIVFHETSVWCPKGAELLRRGAENNVRYAVHTLQASSTVINFPRLHLLLACLANSPLILLSVLLYILLATLQAALPQFRLLSRMFRDNKMRR